MSTSINIGYENLVNYNNKYEGISLIKQLSNKDSIRINNFGDRCVREFPHCESPEMYKLFRDENLIKKDIDVTDIHVELFGEQIKHLNGTNGFDNFNKITIYGSESLVNAFLSQNILDKKVNIFINSIRNIPQTSVLHDFKTLNEETFNIQDTEVQQIIDSYGVQRGDVLNEFPMTQQYCNWYECFNLKTKEDYYNRFVVIVTNEKLYNVYRQLYPHFIIITQPNTSFQCVGLTRHTELIISMKMKTILTKL
jgi:hypothetical protein